MEVNTRHFKYSKGFFQMIFMIPICPTFFQVHESLAHQYYMLMFSEIFTETQMPVKVSTLVE